MVFAEHPYLLASVGFPKAARLLEFGVNRQDNFMKMILLQLTGNSTFYEILSARLSTILLKFETETEIILFCSVTVSISTTLFFC